MMDRHIDTDANLASATHELGGAPPGRFRRSKRALKWLLIGLATVFAIALLAPFLVSQAEYISLGADFVKAHPVGFAIVRLTVYGAVIYYWPALIRWRLRNQKNISPDFLAALQHRGRPIRLLIAFELLTSLPLILNL